MKPKILITGPPRCGKSTLISKLLDYFNKLNYTIHGFLTPEIRKKGNRIGFDIKDIYSQEYRKLARIGNYDTKYKVGKYSVFVEELEEMISKLELIEFNEINLLVIDEIGKMELYSKKFQNFIRNIFSSDVTILATIGLKLKHPVKNFILDLPNVSIFNLNHQNFQEIYQKIVFKIIT
ncbi:MAG: NTPase [Promethearchaeota archaeon]